MTAILYQKDFVKKGDLRFHICYQKDYFGNWSMLWEHIYVYTNRCGKIVYELKVRLFHQDYPVPRIWIPTRRGVYRHMYRIIYIRVHAQSRSAGRSGHTNPH
jgi:hypothetical protein